MLIDGLGAAGAAFALSSEECQRADVNAVPPVRGCLKSRMVRTVTVRLVRLPASLQRKGVRISHHG
ncbi:MAG: hypothetical protein WBQ59_09385, partial [Candidatus Acidiferrum sp.]